MHIFHSRLDNLKETRVHSSHYLRRVSSSNGHDGRISMTANYPTCPRRLCVTPPVRHPCDTPPLSALPRKCHFRANTLKGLLVGALKAPFSLYLSSLCRSIQLTMLYGGSTFYHRIPFSRGRRLCRLHKGDRALLPRCRLMRTWRLCESLSGDSMLSVYV